MAAYEMELEARAEIFDEEAYLLANPDVAAAVRAGQFASGRQHFDLYGCRDDPRRLMRMSSRIGQAKQAKLERILPLMRRDVAALRQETCIDCLPASVRERWNIVATSAVSRHGYGNEIKGIIERHPGGLILDVGAGCRPVYYDTVVNYEIVPYDTTDVLGVGEELPFRDGAFDAIVSVAVLEHVKDPFRCAAEMIRVLKPGGELYCEVPLLQPVHGYPHHYYNMTHQGLRNLFEGGLMIDRVWVPDHMHPIWALTWILESWGRGLDAATRERFLDLRVRDLLGDPAACGDLDFVAGLSDAARTELACGNALFGRKPSA
jgi:SAM-dependent methyltransferase